MTCEEVTVDLYLDKHGMTVKRQFGAPQRATDVTGQSVVGHTILHANSLQRGAWLALEDGVATVIQVKQGDVWISEEGSFIDHILVAGQHYAIDRPGVAIVSMQSQAHVAMHLPIGGMPPRRIDLHAAGDGKGHRLYQRRVIDSVVAFLLAAFPWRPSNECAAASAQFGSVAPMGTEQAWTAEPYHRPRRGALDQTGLRRACRGSLNSTLPLPRSSEYDPNHERFAPATRHTFLGSATAFTVPVIEDSARS